LRRSYEVKPFDANNTHHLPYLSQKAAEKKAAEEEEKASAAAVAQRRADAAFGRWVVDKRVHDEALAILPKLSSMGSDDEDWNKLLLAVAYTQIYLTDQHTQYAVEVSENKKLSLEYVFVNFTKKYHGFDMVGWLIDIHCIIPNPLHLALFLRTHTRNPPNLSIDHNQCFLRGQVLGKRESCSGALP